MNCGMKYQELEGARGEWPQRVHNQPEGRAECWNQQFCVWRPNIDIVVKSIYS